jgi:uncharacterized integral membrane protein
MIALLLLALIIAVLALVFAIQNPFTIKSVTFLFWTFDVSLALLVILSVIGGILVGCLVMMPGTLKRSRQLHRLQKQLDKMDKVLERDKDRERELAEKPKAKPEEEEDKAEDA